MARLTECLDKYISNKLISENIQYNKSLKNTKPLKENVGEPLYLVRFKLADGGYPANEDYYYRDLEDAKQHLNLFREDNDPSDAELYSSISLYDCTDIKNPKLIDSFIYDSIREAYDAFKDMKQSFDGEYTDGLGGSYSEPDVAYSDIITVRGRDFRYDYTNKKLEYVRVDDNGVDVIDSRDLSLGNWLDNPQFWCDTFIDYIDDEVNFESSLMSEDYIDKSSKVILVKRKGEDGYRIWGTTHSDSVDADFLNRASKQNNITYIDAIVVPNGGEEYKKAYDFEQSHKDSMKEAKYGTIPDPYHRDINKGIESDDPMDYNDGYEWFAVQYKSFIDKGEDKITAFKKAQSKAYDLFSESALKQEWWDEVVCAQNDIMSGALKDFVTESTNNDRWNPYHRDVNKDIDSDNPIDYNNGYKQLINYYKYYNEVEGMDSGHALSMARGECAERRELEPKSWWDEVKAAEWDIRKGKLKKFVKYESLTESDNDVPFYKYGILVRHTGDDKYCVWGGYDKPELPDGFMDYLNKPRYAHYDDAIVVPYPSKEWDDAMAHLNDIRDRASKGYKPLYKGYQTESMKEHDQRTFAIEYCKCIGAKAKLDGYKLTINGELVVSNVSYVTYNELIKMIDEVFYKQRAEQDKSKTENYVYFNKKLIESVDDTIYRDKKLTDSADEPDAWSEKEVQDFLTDCTKHFKDREGSMRTYYYSEKEYAKRFLKKHYKYVSVSDGRGSEGEEMSWVVAFSTPIQ